MKALRKRSIAAALLTASCAMPSGANAVDALPRLGVDRSRITVSGVSSGAFMAVQMHVAHSADIRGAGIVNGGPYNCAEGSLVKARMRCMATERRIPVEALAATTRERARRGGVDDVANLRSSRVYLFFSARDSVIKQHVFDSLLAYYQEFVVPANLAVKNLVAEHAMVTDDYGGDCSKLGPPFINDCDFDLAGEILKHLYGPLVARRSGALAGRLIEFDQTPYIEGHDMATAGLMFVPQNCLHRAGCRLHVAFHGGRQNTAFVGTEFVHRSGYNRWADSNDIIVLYPQTGAGAFNGCWDWWGYGSAEYALKSGPQMRAVMRMIDRLAGRETPVRSAAMPSPLR